MPRLHLAVVSAVALLALTAPAANADDRADATSTSTTGPMADVLGDNSAFAGYGAINGAGATGLEATMVVPDYDCQPAWDGQFMVTGIYVYTPSWPSGDHLSGGGGVSMYCSDQGVMTYTPLLFDSADIRVVDQTVQPGDKIRIAYEPESPDVAISTMVNLTQGWDAETLRFGTGEVRSAWVGIRNDIQLFGQYGNVLTPEQTKFSKLRLDGKKVKPTTMGANTMDYGLGDPYLVPTKMKRTASFKINKWHPEG